MILFSNYRLKKYSVGFELPDFERYHSFEVPPMSFKVNWLRREKMGNTNIKYENVISL